MAFFTCANCGALYQVVRGEVGSESASGDVACRSCGATMPGRDGKFVLKYFHLRDGGRRWQKRKRKRKRL
jgi:DNA-directed RNA polymerase subunit RPC12/RpoP